LPIFELLLAAKTLSPGKPNILLIVADDLSPENFGFHGGQRIPTPHLDRLASSTMVGVCNSGRITGAFLPAK
jgi:hypothetical protein